MLIGVLGGLVVGMTSVGSGSLMIVLLLFLYPRLSAGQLVGTDLVQAIPLVASAALGHLLFGDFQLDLTTSLLLGAVPGVYLGAHISAKASDRVIPAGAAARVDRVSPQASRSVQRLVGVDDGPDARHGCGGPRTAKSVPDPPGRRRAGEPLGPRCSLALGCR